MIASPIMFAAALATLSPTNAPSSFGTDSESRFSFALDCGSLVVRNADGMCLFAQTTDTHHLMLRLKPAKGQLPDAWKLESVDAPGTRSFLAEGQFADNDVALMGWSSARVRVSGPDAASTQITAKRSRHVFVITVR